MSTDVAHLVSIEALTVSRRRVKTKYPIEILTEGSNLTFPVKAEEPIACLFSPIGVNANGYKFCVMVELVVANNVIGKYSYLLSLLERALKFGQTDLSLVSFNPTHSSGIVQFVLQGAVNKAIPRISFRVGLREAVVVAELLES